MNTWISVRYDSGIDYKFLWKVVGVVTVILLFVAYWGQKLRRLNRQLKEANERLKEMSERDSLTELYNRRYFSAHGEHTFALCQRSGLVFSIAIFDIDHFKNVNDTYGHLFGDKCLQELSKILLHSFIRHSDTVARFGGEEFAVFTAGEETDALLKKAESVRFSTENTPIKDDNGTTITMTVSSGVYACVPAKDDTLDSFIQKADDALYQAKADGRNRVVFWEKKD